MRIFAHPNRSTKWTSRPQLQFQVKGVTEIPLTLADAQAHKRRTRRLLIQTAFILAAVLIGAGTNTTRLVEIAIVVGIFQQVRLTVFLMDDLRARGANPAWAIAPGFSLLVWFVWRHWHPIQTTRGPVQ